MTGRRDQLRILLVDDERPALRRLEIHFGRRSDVDVVAACQDGVAALNAIEQLKPDIVFLDISMPVLDGVSVAQTVRRAGGPAVVFVTAHDEYAVDAFRAHAVDYLLKPVAAARLDEALTRARASMEAKTAARRIAEMEGALNALRDQRPREKPPAPDLWVKDRGRVVRVRQDDIDWVEAERDYVRLHVGARSWLMRETMQNMEDRLNGDAFVRVHRSAIVNASRVRMAQTTASGARVLTLGSGRQVRVGRSYEPAVARLTSDAP